MSKQDHEEDVEVQDELRMHKAEAINEFLAQTSLGFTPHVAFERATDGSTTTPLRMPSNVTLVRRGA